MLRSRARVGWVIVLAVIAVACSSGPKEPPSETAARKALESKLREPLSRNQIRIRSFAKLGGYEFSKEVYVVEYRSEIECLTEYRGLFTNGSPAGTIITVEARKGKMSLRYDYSQVANVPPGPHPSAYQEAIENPGLWFTKTSRGWEGEDHNLY